MTEFGAIGVVSLWPGGDWSGKVEFVQHRGGASGWTNPRSGSGYRIRPWNSSIPFAYAACHSRLGATVSRNWTRADTASATVNGSGLPAFFRLYVSIPASAATAAPRAGPSFDTSRS